MCPHATDIMALRQNQLVAAKNQIQVISFFADDSSTGTPFQGSTFALTFKSKINETYTTRPLFVDVASVDKFNAFVLDVQFELMLLPTSVIDKVVVTGASATHPNGNAGFQLFVEFTGTNVQGPQNMLTVKSYGCSDGCTPKVGTVYDVFIIV